MEGDKLWLLDQKIEDFQLIVESLQSIIDYNSAIILELLEEKTRLEEPHKKIGFVYWKHKKDNFNWAF